MDYEKAYKEAIIKAKALYGQPLVDNTLLEDIFPELKESEDERIRKALITFFNRFPYDSIESAGTNAKETIAWLEKQGEKELPESKFKVDDWIISNVNENRPNRTVAQITSIHNSLCYIRDIWGSVGYETLDGLRDNYRLWTIDDAKFGDVLVNGSNIFIFHFVNVTRLMGYCHVNTDDGRFYDDIGKNECFCLIDAVVNPATKEQRVLLFQKMNENGYMWDAEKLELKKYKPVKKKEVTGKLKEMVDELNSVDLEKDVEVNGDSLTFHNLTAEEICCLIGHLTNMRLPNTFNQPAFRNDDWDSMDVPYCTQVLDLLKEIRDKLSKVHDKIPEQVPFFPYERYFPPTEPLKPYYNSETRKIGRS